MWAVVIGGTGQVGRQVLALLGKDGAYERVVSITRRPLSALPHAQASMFAPRIEEHVLDDITAFDLGTLGQPDRGVAVHIFCCFGSTRKQAGGGSNFERLEKAVIGGYIHKARQWFTTNTKDIKAPEEDFNKTVSTKKSSMDIKNVFALVSSTGANADSWLLYARVKGELEQMAIKELRGVCAVRIFRPAFLQCQREEDFRIGEVLVAPFVLLARLVAPSKVDIATADLAKAMIADCKLHSSGSVKEAVLVRSNAECLLLSQSQQ